MHKVTANNSYSSYSGAVIHSKVCVCVCVFECVMSRRCKNNIQLLLFLPKNQPIEAMLKSGWNGELKTYLSVSSLRAIGVGLFYFHNSYRTVEQIDSAMWELA